MFESSCFPKDDTHPILYSSNKIKKGKKINKRKKQKRKNVLMGKNITLFHHIVMMVCGVFIINIPESKAFDIYAHEIQWNERH